MNQGRMDWMSRESEMESIRNRGGWTLELGGESRNVQGSRRETRDASRGRDPQDTIASLDQDERYMYLGLSNSFLEEARKRRADILDERIKQIDSGGDIASRASGIVAEIAQAYLDCYYGSRLVAILNQEIAQQAAEIHVLEERRTLSEALPSEVLEARAAVAGREKQRLEWELKTRRGIQKLSALWGVSDLDSAMLASPEIDTASTLASMSLPELLELAWVRRTDAELKRAALATVDQHRPYVRTLPELDFGVQTRYGDYDRDFADEGREDSGLEVRVELELRIPLSQARRNAAQDRQFQLSRGARVYELAGLRNQIEEEIQMAYDEFALAREDARLRRLQLAAAEEAHRLVVLKSTEMPESLGANPLEAARKARIDLLDSRVAALESERTSVEALIQIHAVTGGFPNAQILAAPGFPVR